MFIVSLEGKKDARNVVSENGFFYSKEVVR